jgi:hypothetical protein
MNMLKIIFLDIDGVLNSHKWWDSEEHKQWRDNIPNNVEDIDWSGQFDPEAVAVLIKILELTEAVIVVSSTWRSNMDRVIKALYKRGLKNTNLIIDKTPRSSHLSNYLRGNEILEWMKDNEKLIGCDYSSYKNYLILDDDSDMLYWQKDNFVQIDGKVGLVESDIERCVKILNQN